MPAPASAQPDSTANPSRDSVSSFRFLDRDFDAATGLARFRYAFDKGPVFEETFRFPVPENPLPETRRAAVDRALRQLHLAAGVSYYKAFVPPRITLAEDDLDPDTASFLQTLYENGLGEFAFRNGLDLRGRIRFPSIGGAKEAAPVELPRRSLLPIGGGKDSIVSLETLRRAGEPLLLFGLRPAEPIPTVMRESGQPTAIVDRRLSQHLLDLNAQGALNGHVPITAILSFAAAVTALLLGCDNIVMSNERSADVGNLVVDGMDVNHQYSKSHAFETAMAAHLARTVTPSLGYFSLLRPFSELAIVRMFAEQGRYFDVFTSCNRAFHLGGSRLPEGRRWCRDCPKCRFVFLALAPFLEKERLLGIFGANLLDQPNQETGFRELLGLTGHKPFECVGEVEEAGAALYRLIDHPSWRDDAIVSALADALRPQADALNAAFDRALAASGTHAIPARYQGLFPDLPSGHAA